MNDKIGNISFELPRDGEATLDKPYSEATAQMIDEEVRALIDTSHRTTQELLTKHRDDVEKVNNFTTFLLEMSRNLTIYGNAQDQAGLILIRQISS